MSDRGMKKWAPYASLIEQSTCLEKMLYQRNKVEKPHISQDKAEEINRILANYHKQELIITYYYDGYLYTIKTKIRSINMNERMLYLPQGKIPFNEILNIADENVSESLEGC